MKSVTAFYLVVLMHSVGISQSYWNRMNESEIKVRNEADREIIPQNYLTFGIEHNQVASILATAPMEFSSNFLDKAASFYLPMPDGELTEFMIWKAPVMEDELAAKYPSIQTYKGYKKGDQNIVTRFSVGPNGFHAAIISSEGQVYIDPYSTGNKDHYIIYNTEDHEDQSLKDKIFCGTDEISFQQKNSPKWGVRSSIGEKMEMRKYRLALGCTGEWGASRGTVEKALSDMVTFVERANIIFEKELAIRVVLIARNDLLINLDPNADFYTNSDKGLEIVGQNTSILNGKIGAGSYDIGHVFSVCFDVGGVAAGNICTSARGAGVTCHNNSSISNGIVLVFNHEVGHQMTASHTFNNCPGQEGQLSGTGYEPGGGSTIMAYPGACGASNLGVSRDDYYHAVNLEQILTYTNVENATAYLCAEKVDIDNYKPIINLPYTDGFSIPKSTPFFLKGSAEDANGDIMTFNWDQYDNQTSSPLGNPIGNAPIFRSLKPTLDPARYFPNVTRILNGEFTNKTELLPTYGRELTFRFVVRDNHPLGNAAVWEQLKFKVADNAGPFKITYPVQNYKFRIGDEVNVTWDVANTDIAPVNCKFVDIYFALNNSLDFESEKLVLAVKGTPNDGSEKVIVPNVASTSVRVVVKASDNIFFSVGLFNSRIDIPATPNFFMDVEESTKKICLPERTNFVFSTAGFAGLNEKINFEIVGDLPDGAIATFTNTSVNPGESTSLNLDLTQVKGTKYHQIVVRSFVPGIDTIERVVALDLTGTDLNLVQLIGPEDGLSGVGPTQTYQWELKNDAEEYELEVSTTPSFDSNSIVINTAQSNGLFNSTTFLEKATVYFWRVKSTNACKDGAWSETYAFNTEALNCTLVKSGTLGINISQSGTPTIEVPLDVTANGIVNDVNLKNVRGDHQWSGDLAAYLISPVGTEILLWSRKCGSSKGFFIGLDDQSNEFFNCPINTGKVYQPVEPLAKFNGQNTLGRWMFRIEDLVTGNGGRLQNVDLELCSNIILSPPVLVKNELLTVQYKDNRIISNSELLCEDSNNTTSEIEYTIVKSPLKGILTINGTPLEVGTNFNQEDINQGRLMYMHNADDRENDAFRFIVTDGQGGWISITQLDIAVESNTTSTQELASLDRILVYPNPVLDMLHIKSLDQKSRIAKCELISMNGSRIMYIDSLEEQFSIDLSDKPSGMYLIRLHTSSQIITKKIVKR